MIQEFLKHIHSEVDGLIEIREIEEATAGNKPKSKALFMAFSKLKDYIPPQDKHVYFGVYSRARRGGKIKDCLTTNVIWVDYDEMSLEEVKTAIEKANIPAPTIYINSGYGIHAYWKLNKRVGHEAQPIVKAIVKVTGADQSATDIARTMRLPGTNNVKYGACKPCRVLEVSHTVYDLSEIEKAVQVEYKASKGRTGITTGKPCVDTMLQGVGKGHRNFALGRITKQFQRQGYTRSKALEEVLKFNDRCEPPKNEAEVITDFNAYWDKDYKLLGCKINDTRLQSILSEYCNYTECNQKVDVFNIEIDNGISYNNRTIFKDYSGLNGNDLIVLGILKKYSQGLNRSRLEQALYSPGAKQSLMTSKTLESILKKLQGLKLIEFMDIAKDRGNNYKNYFAKYIDQSNYGMGFTLVSNGAIMGAIDRRITPGQYKLYVLLLKYAYGKNEAYPSTITLAKGMGTSQQFISTEIKALQSAGYLEISYVYPKGLKTSNYRLLI